MDRLWVVLLEIYGHQLHSQYGETIPESWELLLKGVSPELIKTGLERLTERTDMWPPNAAEFKQLCEPRAHTPKGKHGGGVPGAYVMFDDPAHPAYKPKAIESDASKEAKRAAQKKFMSEFAVMLPNPHCEQCGLPNAKYHTIIGDFCNRIHMIRHRDKKLDSAHEDYEKGYKND